MRDWLFKKLFPHVKVPDIYLITLYEIEDIWYSVPQPTVLNEKFAEAMSVFLPHMEANRNRLCQTTSKGTKTEGENE